MIAGSMVALVTPMDAQGRLDWDSLSKLVDFHLKEGTNAIVAVGTTGESATLDVNEHIEVIRRVVQQVAGRIPVIAGTGANLHFGVTGGYLSAWGRYGAPGGATYKDPEKLKTDFEVPFVGLYGVLTNKGFFADTLVRWDFYQSTTSRKALSDTFNDFTLDLPSVKNKARGLVPLQDGRPG